MGRSDRIRVPFPAARITAAGALVLVFVLVIAPGRLASGIRGNLPDQDSNLEWLYQKQLCCQLHHRAVIDLVPDDARRDPSVFHAPNRGALPWVALRSRA